MLRRAPWRSPGFALLAAVVAGVVALSCGGGAEQQSVSGPAPVAFQPPAASDDSGSVSEAAKPTTFKLVCHYDATTGTFSQLNLPEAAFQAHLKHERDKEGSCLQATCPCFAAADLTPSCPEPDGACSGGSTGYSLLLGCAVGDSLTLSSIVSVDLVAGSCSVFKAPDSVASQTGLTPGQLDACAALIVSNAYDACPNQ